jgi:hypothetical protein
MKGPACKFHCTNECWHAVFLPLVRKRSLVKGRCDYLLKKIEARRKRRAALSSAKGTQG